jgi:hypothetical protein
VSAIKMQITKVGGVQMLHDDAVDLSVLGQVEVTRASHVEFDNAKQRWFVQSARTLEILRDDFLTREEALAWEKQHYSPGGKGWAELTEEK